MTDVHSCSYHCDRPECIKAQRDELRDRLAQPERHDLQAKGEHPAPCARHCEATAFQIVINNLKAQLAQPEQEPVATVQCIHGITIGYLEIMLPVGTKLYTSPPQRKPLTDGAEAVINAARAAMDASTEAQDGEGGIKIASDLAASLSLCLDEYDRAIGAAHGIKGGA
jgi:hypothetical protein